MCFGNESWIINPAVGGREVFSMETAFFKNSEVEVNHDSYCGFGRLKT